MVEPTAATPFALVGAEAMRRLAHAFYDRVEQDPLLRPLFPGSLFCARKEMGSFLIETFGGPSEFRERRGSARLGERHAKFAIGPAERDAWLAHMFAAMAALSFPPEVAGAMELYFREAAALLVNRSGPEPVHEPRATAGTDAAPTAWVRKRWAVQQRIEAAWQAAMSGELARMREILAEPSVAEELARYPQPLRDLAGYLGTRGAHEPLREALRLLDEWPGIVDLPGDWGFSLLHQAAIAGLPELAAELLARGANPDAGNTFAHPPLYYAANSCPGKGDTGEHWAQVADLLLTHGADPNIVSGPKQTTPLHMTARHGNIRVTERLLAGRAHVDPRDSKGETPLRRAVNCRRIEVARLLLAHGADPDSRDHRGVSVRESARDPGIRELLG